MLKTCQEWNQIEQDRTNRDLGKRSPKGSRIRKFQQPSDHIFEYSMNTVEELCKVRTTPCSRSSGKWFSQKTSNRKAVRSNPIQGFYKTNKNKEQNSIPKESMPKQHGFGTIQDCNLRPNELKDLKKVIWNMEKKHKSELGKLRKEMRELRKEWKMKAMKSTPIRIQDEYVQKVIFKRNRRWKLEHFKTKKK